MGELVTYQDILRVAQSLPMTENQVPWDEIAGLFYRRLIWHGSREDYGIETEPRKELDPKHPIVIQVTSMLQLVGELGQINALLWFDQRGAQMTRLYWALVEDIVARSMTVSLAIGQPPKPPTCEHCARPMEQNAADEYFCKACTAHRIP